MAHNIRKASEARLPEDARRQVIAYVEQLLGHSMTDAERRRFIQITGLAPQMVPGDDPLELRPVLRRGKTREIQE